MGLGFGFCCCGCVYFLDDFERPDSTDLATELRNNWSEEAGDWEIADGKLTVAESDAYCKCVVENDASQERYQASVKVRAVNIGDQVRLYCDDGRRWCEVQIGESAGYGKQRSRFRLYDGETLKGTVDVLYDDLQTNEFILRFCCDGTKITATLIGLLHETYSLSMPGTVESSLCGVGTGMIAPEGTPPTFDDFTLSYHRQDRPEVSPACPTCEESCIYLSDEFVTDELSPADWEIVSGYWSVGSGAGLVMCGNYVETTSPDAMLASNATLPDEEIAFRVWADFSFAAGNGEARLLADYQDEDNHVYIAAIKQESTSPAEGDGVRFEVHVVSGGTDTTVYSSGLGYNASGRLAFCFDAGVMQAFAYSFLPAGGSVKVYLADIPYQPATSEVRLWADPDPGDPYYYYESGTIRFCWVRADRARNTADECTDWAGCGSGCNTCAGGTWRHKITVRLAGIGNAQCEDCQSPWTVELSDYYGPNGGWTCTWRAAVKNPCGSTLTDYLVYCSVGSIGNGLYEIGVEVYNPLGGLVAFWRKEIVADSLDCTDLAGELLADREGLESDPYCDWSAATCEIVGVSN